MPLREECYIYEFSSLGTTKGNEYHIQLYTTKEGVQKWLKNYRNILNYDIANDLIETNVIESFSENIE